MKEHHHNSPHPPTWAEWLAEWLTSFHLHEEVLGDLQELFTKRLQTSSVSKARCLYVVDLLKLLHPRLWHHPPLIYTPASLSERLLFGLNSSLKGLYRHRASTSLSFFGLTLGISCFLLLAMATRQELSYDSYHEKKDRIYRVTTHTMNPEGSIYNAGTPYPLASSLRREVSGIEKVAQVHYLSSGLIGISSQSGAHTQYLEKNQVGFVNPSFFDLFDYEWIAG
jgi:hypothetical protein